MGTTEASSTSTSPDARSAAFFTEQEVAAPAHGRRARLRGRTRRSSGSGHRPDRQAVRIGADRLHGRRRVRQAAVAGGFGPAPTTSRSSRTRPTRSSSASSASAAARSARCAGVMIAVVPREGVSREEAMREVEEIMRIRHGLTLDQPNDFDIVTQDAILKVWDQISQATFSGAGRHLVDRADGRRHRRDGDHDDLRHRADPRDRRPQGARRAPRARSSASSCSRPSS